MTNAAFCEEPFLLTDYLASVARLQPEETVVAPVLAITKNGVEGPAPFRNGSIGETGQRPAKGCKNRLREGLCSRCGACKLLRK